MEIRYRPIGVVHSPHRSLEGMPIQPSGARGIRGRVVIEAEFAAGLKDLDGFSHLILVYHLHRSKGASLTVVPFMDPRPRGVFATRAPNHPNPIGISVVRLVKVSGRELTVADVDILDGTPLLDVKPYVPEFDQPDECRTGWLEKARGRSEQTRADGRFAAGRPDDSPKAG